MKERQYGQSKRRTEQDEPAKNQVEQHL